MTRQLKRDLLRRCAALLASALLLRGAMLWGPALLRLGEAAAEDPQYVSFLCYLTTGQVLKPEAEPEAKPRQTLRALPVLRFRALPPEETPTAADEPNPIETPEETHPAGLVDEPASQDSKPQETAAPVFTEADAEGIPVNGNCTLTYDKTALLLAALPELPKADGPRVLIVHTHSTEAYTIEPGWEYEETEICRTLDPDHSVIRLGTEIADQLEARGISVLHDTTINDYPSYNGSYDRMAAIIQSYLDQYPSIQMVLDVHRDAFENADGSLGGTAGDGRARVMLVVGTNEGGLFHPNWQGNLSFALKLEVLMERNTPGMSRGISLCTQRYNQNLTPLSLLAEFGAAGDTLEEALAAARDFSASLAELLLAT